jgi:hypothetical protein
MTISDLTAAVAAHIDAAFYLASLLGMLAHYAKKWGRGEYAGNLMAYLVADNPRASFATVMSCLGASAAIVATGTLHSMDTATALALGFTTGFAIDSAVNKTGGG